MDIIFKITDRVIQLIDSLKWVVLVASVIYAYRDELRKLFKRDLEVTSNGMTFRAQSEKKKDKTENDVLQKIEDTKEPKEILKIIETKNTELKNKDQQIFKLTLEKHFEYTYRLIFRSQILLLVKLQMFDDGIAIIEVEKHLEDIKSQFELFINWDVDNYIRFLFDQNLVEKDITTHKLKITLIGKLFLQYLDINNYKYVLEKNL